MKISEIEYIQLIVRIRGKYHIVILNEATKKMLPEFIVGMEGKIKLLKTDLPLEEIGMDEIKRISEMCKCQEKQ